MRCASRLPLRFGGLAVVALLAACGERGDGAGGAVLKGDTVPVVRVPTTVPLDSLPAGPRTGESDGAIGVRVEQPRPGRLVVNGATRAVPSVQVSVEDGERVLFGPADVPVSEGRFRIDLTHEPTGRPSVSVYVADPEGMHQTVVPIARGAASAAAGGAQDVVPVAGASAPAAATAEVAVPPPGGGATGDRRTRVTELAIESPRVRVQVPGVKEGDRRLTVSGETRLMRLFVAVARRDTALATESVALEGRAGVWKPFAVSVPVPGGLQPGDAVVVSTGPRPGDRELVFQPLRN